MIALDRVLKLLESAPAHPDVTRGHLDLLGEVEEPHDTVAQRLMRSVALPRIYEQVWRPVVFGLAKGGPLGPSTAEEYALARGWLGLAEMPGATVLDVACGPGNVTRALASGVTGGGLVVGVDASATMLGRAVADTPASEGVASGGAAGGGAAGGGAAEVAYVRCDADDLPFREGAFDAVCCYGALYLFEDPWAAIAGMARVLRPGGRIVVLTTRRPRLPLVGRGMGVLSQATGIRMFGPEELSTALAAAGFSAIRRRSYGLMQFAGATLTSSDEPSPG
jgi:ubiquinone/menaquinone biosynthesis C-methylase UbiE